MGWQVNLVVRCPRCEMSVTGVEQGGFDHYPDNQYEWSQYTLVSCPECKQPFLLLHECDTRQDDEGHYNSYWSAPKVIYPSVVAELDPAVPKNIAASHLEAMRSFELTAVYTGTAILCRRTLEGICSHLGETKGNLSQKLKALKDKGHIDGRIFEWADDVLRALGNDAAHDVDVTIERQDAKDALDFTKAIIEYIFVFQAAFERFKAERERRKLAKLPKVEEAG